MLLRRDQSGCSWSGDVLNSAFRKRAYYLLHSNKRFIAFDGAWMVKMLSQYSCSGRMSNEVIFRPNDS